ncbi:MAG: redoxin domain-containing protein, partial [Acidimicrobiales bacterium]|nr:redoxin domain-containing protein [Acidimicrobiales bacterium]
MPMNPDIDRDFAPSKRLSASLVHIGDEAVVLIGWDRAVLPNGAGAAVWPLIDGVRSVADIAGLLAGDSAESGPSVEEVLDAVRHLGAERLLANVEPEPDGGPPLLTPVRQPEVGDILAPLTVTDLDGRSRSLADVATGDVLLVSWNPHCGYCASIAMELAPLHDPLREAGTALVFLAFGDAADNRELAERSGVTAPVLLLGDADNPFGGAGTPSAFHLDSGRRIVAAAYGNIEVPALARTLAGVDDNPTTDDQPKVQYLLERDGLCAAGTGTTGGPTWTDTVVYRVGNHHVGVRVDSTATAALLDRLFDGNLVEDPRAGHSYSVALPSVAGRA